VRRALLRALLQRRARRGETDVAYWTDWVGRRMRHVREMAELVDLFIAPARYLHDRFRDEFGLPESKLVYLDYGFARERMAGRSRAAESRSRSGTSAPTSRRRASTTSSGRSDWLGGQRQAAHLGPASRTGHRGSSGHRRLAAARRGGAGRVASGIQEPGDRRRRLRPLRRDRRPVGLGRELSARDPRGPAGARARDHRRRRGHGGVRAARGQRPAVRASLRRSLAGRCSASSTIRPSRHASARGLPLQPVRRHSRDRRARSRGRAALRPGPAPTRVHAHRVRAKGPWRITFDTNPDTCNLRCVMCEEHSRTARSSSSARRRRSRAGSCPSS
jgi:hypothetical protein